MKAGEESNADGTVTWENVSDLLEDLKCTARALIAREGNAGTVHTTQVVNSSLKRLLPTVRDWQEVSWESRRHFFADAHQAMRRLLIDYARSRATKKRDHVRVGGFESGFLNGMATTGVLDLDRLVEQSAARTELAEAIDRALVEIDRAYPEKHLAEIVQLRAFEELSQGEIARILGLTERTIRNREKLAYALLREELADLFPAS